MSDDKVKSAINPKPAINPKDELTNEELEQVTGGATPIKIPVHQPIVVIKRDDASSPDS